MEKAKVFWTDMRCKTGDSLLHKMDRLIKKAGIEEIDFNNKFVCVKVHFGEPGNLAFLRPNFAKTVCDKIKKLGGRPFLADCNTLYVGRRKDALMHMEAAFENGYTPLSTGVHNIIADGLKGTDDIEVPVKGAQYCKVARIGRAVMDADIVISLNHFKGHENASFGGALKNIGMGCGSRAGKMAMHNEGKPEVQQEVCRGCKTCAKFCAHNAISFNASKKASIDHKKCVGCGRCIGTCNYSAISNNVWSANDILNAKIAEYSKAVLDGRPNFHITVINQVSPFCDCHAESDAPIVPDIGIFAGFNPVALDRACLDAINAAPAIASSILGERDHKHTDHGTDHFIDVHPATNGLTQLTHAEKIGLGTSQYELIKVK
ncbi:4Fe-4S ferredoxin [Spirochaetia bacterium]|nr:4Fe-4S ferredoxin [Spirochaetia bacterium]